MDRVLRNASQVFQAEKAAIVTCSQECEHDSPCRFRLGRETVRATEHFSRFDPWMHEIMKHEPQGFYCGSPEDEMPLEQFRRSRAFHDYYQKHGIEWAVAAIIFNEEGAARVLPRPLPRPTSLQRRRQGPIARAGAAPRPCLPHPARISLNARAQRGRPACIGPDGRRHPDLGFRGPRPQHQPPRPFPDRRWRRAAH